MYEQNQILKDYRSRRKSRIIYIMGDSCACCGYNRSMRALELHHLCPDEKEFSLSQWVVNWEATLKELQKCILVCSNCHREIHDDLIDNSLLKTSFIPQRAEEISKEVQEAKKGKQHYCNICGAAITKKATYCQLCSSKIQQIAERPSREQLKNDIRSLPMIQVGKKYGVSDNAIRKWCKSVGLPSKVSDIKAFSDEEWQVL